MAVRKKALRSPEDVIISQRACQALLSNQEVLAAFQEAQESYLESWANTKPDETGKRELAYQQYKALADVWKVIQRNAGSAHVRDLREKSNG